MNWHWNRWDPLEEMDEERIENAPGKLARILNLSHRKLSALPESVSECSQLQWLDVSGNQLTSLPKFIGRLSQLQQLYLSSNKLSVLPEYIGQLFQLQELDLSNNELGALPESIGEIRQLREFDTSRNQLNALPESIGKMRQLRKFDASRNRLSVLPESIREMRQLQELDLSANQLSVLPESIAEMTQLRALDVSANRLTALPESIAEMTQLRALDVSANQLRALPESIAEVRQLRELDASANQLTALPEHVGQLSELQALDVSNNQLSALPQSLRQLVSLKQLYLHGNDALGIPTEVLGPTSVEVAGNIATPANPKSILDYYFRIHPPGVHDYRRVSYPLNEAKLILIGRGEVGKTCIVNRLVRDDFVDTRKTQGISITQWPIVLDTGEEVRLHIWDFGGQEIMHATHQFFLSHRSVYLLVLNGRQGGEDVDAEYWLQLIESFGGDSPVIVVLNKIREHAFDLNRRGLQGKYPAIREFVRTDCADATGIDELHGVIRRETHGLKDLRVPFPAAWISIKERLSGMSQRGQNYLSFPEYRRTCEELGESNAEAQEALASYLHSLGIALNYKDDPRLNDTHVLSPHWVTNGIYSILNWPELEARKGVLRLDDLAVVLAAEAYPKEKHLFLLDLMKKFEICFEFPDDPQRRYLVPELLDKQEPAVTTEFTPAQCLNFQYHYNLLPEGLLPRFIVRTNVLSEGEERWRTGVVLRFEGNWALVKGDVSARKVFISVEGPLEGRRRLLAIIRSDFERIHADIKKLEVAEMVPVQGRPEAVVAYKKLVALDDSGMPQSVEVFGSDVVELDVKQLLNGVDIEGSHDRRRGAERKVKALSLFYSYSHKDETLRNELETHLKLLQRQGLISTWHDRKITAGAEWMSQIDRNLETADIILLLVSADFIASEYCYNIEMKRALERHEEGCARVIPVILRDLDWHSAPFGKLQALPEDGKAVMLWPDKDSAWKDVARGIRKAVEGLRERL